MNKQNMECSLNEASEDNVFTWKCIFLHLEQEPERSHLPYTDP